MFSRRLPHRFVIVYFSLSVMLTTIYRVHCTALFADSANVLFLRFCYPANVAAESKPLDVCSKTLPA